MNQSKMKYLIFIVLAGMILSCESQRQVEYKKAVASYDVNAIEAYIKKYPDDENISQLEYRLRVIEYQKVKESNSIMLLNYFINKYRTGKDVQKVKDKLFEIKFNYKQGDLDYLKHLKTVFSEAEYIQRIEKEIFKIAKRQLSDVSKIKNDEQRDEVLSFLMKYPESSDATKLRKTLNQYDLGKCIQSKNLERINLFLQKHPELFTDKVKEQIANISFEKYKTAPLSILKKFLEENKTHKNYAELEKAYIERAYHRFISFYDYRQLINLHQDYKEAKYNKKVEYFTKNKKEIESIHEKIKSLYLPFPYSEKDTLKMYNIFDNSLKEGKNLMQSAFFSETIDHILKKVSSNFLLIQFSAIKAMEYYYNQNVLIRRVELMDKYKKIEQLKNKHYREKLMLIAFTLNEKELFLSHLNEISPLTSQVIWVRFLKYHFMNLNPFGLIESIFEISKIDFGAIYSKQAVEKNKFDRKINLSLMRNILNAVLIHIQRQKLPVSKALKRKLSKLEYFFKDIKQFMYSDINKYEANALQNLTDLMQKNQINAYLKKDLLEKSPIEAIKLRLKDKGLSEWELKKKQMYKIFLRNKD